MAGPSPLLALDVLVLAAFFPELGGLRTQMAPSAPSGEPGAQGEPGAPGEAMDGHVGRTRVAARVVGIGLPMAAAVAARHVGELHPRAVIAVGTCGAYAGSGLAIGDVVVARRVRLVEPAALEGQSQFPEPMRLESDTHGRMAEGIARATGANPADVATTLAITVDDDAAGRIVRATGAAVEHLEAFGVAVACASLGTPFGAIFGVANFVGACAREQWRLHHHDAEAHATGALLRWLRRSPQGFSPEAA